MALKNNTYGRFDSFYTQKVVNGLPLWARGRIAPESYAFRFVNSFGPQLEDTYRTLRQTHIDRFVSSCDAYLEGSYTFADIPHNLLFEFRQVGDDIVYVKPVVVASDGTSNHSVAVVDDLEDLERALPDRVTVGSTAYDISNILDATVVSNLSSATLNDMPISNWVFVELSGGTDYGSVDDVRFFHPGAVILTGLTAKDVDKPEGRIFYSDDLFRSWNKFSDIETVEVENIDTAASMTIDPWGFNRSRLLERTTTFSSCWSRNVAPLYYKTEDDTNKTLLLFQTRETESIQLKRQGFSAFATQDQAYLLDENDAHVELNDIAKMDTSDWLFGCDDTKIYMWDTHLPSITSEYVVKEVKRRTADSHLALEVRPVSRRRFKINETFSVATRNKTPVSRFSKPVRVRLYSVDATGARTYLQKDGSTAATPEDAWRYPPIAERGTSVWRDKRWSISLSAMGEYALVLETQFLSVPKHPVAGVNISRVEYDVLPVSVASKTAIAEFTMPASVQPVAGLTFDYENNLWLRTTNGGGNQARQVGLHFDSCLIDYANYRIYFREPYTSVVSITSQGLPTHNPPVVNP